MAAKQKKPVDDRQRKVKLDESEIEKINLILASLKNEQHALAYTIKTFEHCLDSNDILLLQSKNRN